MQENIKYVLNLLPAIAALGVLAGFGAYQTVFGALLGGAIFVLFKAKTPVIYSTSVFYTLALGAFNVYLGGESGSLFALVFVSSFFVILFSFIKFSKINFKGPKKAAISGAYTGILTSCIVLCIPLFTGNGTFTSVGLIADFGQSVFTVVSEEAVVCTLLVLVLNHYLSKTKLPAAFLSVLAGVFLNYFYKMKLPDILDGFINFSFPAEANFGKFPQLLLFGLVLSLILTLATAVCLKTSRQKKTTNALIFTGISGIISSVSGFIPGAPVKSRGVEIPVIGPFFTILLFVLAFPRIAPYTPICAVAAVLTAFCAEHIKTNLQNALKKNLLYKFIFVSGAIFVFCSVFWGILYLVLLLLILEISGFKQNLQKNRIFCKIFKRG